MLEEVINEGWDQMFDTYKHRYNALCSEFRLLAPKD